MAQSHLSWLHRPLLLLSGALVMVRAAGFSPQGHLVWSSGSEARGIFPDQGLNLRLLYRRRVLYRGVTWEAHCGAKT